MEYSTAVEYSIYLYIMDVVRVKADYFLQNNSLAVLYYIVDA